ncbi:MAG: alkaline phosphatase D family protein [Candidatus Limnocylindrales bacterium]
MTALLLGPLLRHVGHRAATLWLETDAPCLVQVRAGTQVAEERTFRVAGHDYAIVVIDGLEPGSSTPYEVRLDGSLVWPLAESPFPASRIRTLHPEAPVRLLFGSCREPGEGSRHSGVDPDVLRAYALRMASQAHEEWPDLIAMIGDQIYADDTSATVRKFIRGRRNVHRAPHYEVAGFEEYTALYYESWGISEVRWILANLPSAMIFDDHDVRDDWNTSHAWRQDMQATDWWQERITGALMSYWIYQHLGNLSPAALATDPTLAAIRAASDGEAVLRSFAQAADREADGAKGALWSYRRDLGRVRLLVIDSRCGRILADGQRAMVGQAEFEWIEAQVEDGDYDHLVVGSSLPWLLPRALHDLESWDEALSAGTRGPQLARFGEWLRRAVDLEHWAAFRASFDRLAALFARIGRGEHGSQPPATICVISGDVHHTYVSEAAYPKAITSRIYQITCSPMHNTIPRAMRVVFRLGWSKKAARVMHALGRFAGVDPLTIEWHHPTGPHFGNELALLVFEGRSARVLLERSLPPASGTPGEDLSIAPPGLAIVAELSLTSAPSG